MQRNHCDICGVETLINPRIEMLWDETELKIMAEDGMGGEKEVVIPNKVPRMGVRKAQNPFTGEVEDKPIQMSRDLDPRAFFLQLTVGGETVARDCCRECLNREVLPLLKPLWDKLASMTSQE